RAYGDGPVEQACAAALELDVISVPKVRSIVEKGTGAQAERAAARERQATAPRATAARFARDPREFATATGVPMPLLPGAAAPGARTPVLPGGDPAAGQPCPPASPGNPFHFDSSHSFSLRFVAPCLARARKGTAPMTTSTTKPPAAAVTPDGTCRYPGCANPA